MQELEETIRMVKFMALRDFGPEDPVGASAVVGLEYEDGTSRLYFVVPDGGGRELVQEGRSVTSITAKAPLGAALIEKTLEESFAFTVNGKVQEFDLGISTCHIFNMMGRCPAISVPSGIADNGVPTGLHIVSKAYDDIAVFRVAAAFEKTWEKPKRFDAS